MWKMEPPREVQLQMEWSYITEFLKRPGISSADRRQATKDLKELNRLIEEHNARVKAKQNPAD